MKRTLRGFGIYGEYMDANRHTVRIQQSSRADGPLVWIFCNDENGSDATIHLCRPTAYSPHLRPAQARRVAAALLRFADEAQGRNVPVRCQGTPGAASWQRCEKSRGHRGPCTHDPRTP